MRGVLLPNLIAAAVLVPLGAINAAELGRPARYHPSTVPSTARAVHDWTGLYLGAQLGYGAGDSSGTQNAGGTFFPVVPYAIDPHGFIGGGHVGYNQQLDQWLFGIEADLEAADVKASTVVPAAGQTYFFNAKTDMLASVRGRLGVALDSWLVYLTGGVAWGNVSTPTLSALDGTRTGWTLGAGLEHALGPNWSARLEYRYTDLGEASAQGGEPGAFDDNSFKFHAVRVGLAHKLGRLK